MIRPSSCPWWQPDTATKPAEEHRSYTTSWDTIRSRSGGRLPTNLRHFGKEVDLRSLWRALALAWLGGIGSPMLTDDAMPWDRMTEERPAAAKPGAAAEGVVLARAPARGEQA